MPISDSTQLTDYVTTNVIVSVREPKIDCRLSSEGKVNLFIGSILLSLTPADAALVAASLAMVAANRPGQ